MLEWEVQVKFTTGWERSRNPGLTGTFTSYKGAYMAMEKSTNHSGAVYRVIQIGKF
jgi:hypothetical protein